MRAKKHIKIDWTHWVLTSCKKLYFKVSKTAIDASNIFYVNDVVSEIFM